VKTYTTTQIAQAVTGQVHGDAARVIAGVGSVESAGPGEITWVARDALLKKLPACKAGAVLIQPARAKDVPVGSTAILVDRPSAAIITVLSMFEDKPAVVPGVHPTAVVDPAAALDAGVSVGPHVTIGAGVQVADRTVLHAGVFLGQGVQIGSDCVIWPNVVIREQCIIGSRVIIHPNATIGADGFGYEFLDGRHVKVPQIGNVVIADDVEIGANTCVDRAKFGSTRIGPGTKIDNLVQIAHNVEIGPGVILVAQAAIGGSAKIGAFSVLGGQAGVADHGRIGNQVTIASASAVTGEVPDKTQVAGIFAFDVQKWRRSQIAVRRLPKLLEQVRELARRVQELESANDHPERG
jgi:UDP-3-O-[3-hydroxymyristoyl] glucosamine N-acyltransferase